MRPEEPVLARVGEQFLFETELQRNIPKDIPVEDSVMWAHNYINNWVRKKLIINQAKENLTPEQLDFERELQIYKNSLLIYAYEKRLVQQSLDTSITDQEISEYYQNFSDNFLLKENICKAIFVQLNVDSSKAIYAIRKLFMVDSIDYENVQHLCKKSGAEYALDTTFWYSFEDLLKRVPVKTRNSAYFLRQKKTSEFLDEDSYYFLRIENYQLEDSVTPLNLVKDRIKSILINQKRAELLSTWRTNIVDEAVEGRDYDIY